MAQTLLLAKVIGVFLLVAGAGVAVQRREFLQVAEDFLRHRALRVSVAAIELFAALFLVLLHEDRSSFAAHAILWLGWLAFVEGALYLLLTDRQVRALTAAWLSPTVLLIGGAAAAILGGYLAAFGFGLI